MIGNIHRTSSLGFSELFLRVSLLLASGDWPLDSSVRSGSYKEMSVTAGKVAVCECCI